MEWDCWELLHAGEGPRGEHVTVFCSACQHEAAEQAAEYFHDQEQRQERCGNDPFDGIHSFIEVEANDVSAASYEVVCEVKRVYTAVIR